MARSRAKNRTRSAYDAKTGTSAQQQAASDADELSAMQLEQLHPDVLAEVLQQLGPVEAWRVRAVSKAMKSVVDNASVAWRSLRLAPTSSAQIERAADLVSQSMHPGIALGTRGIRLAKGAALELELVPQLLASQSNAAGRVKRSEAVSALALACSASSGGVGAVRLLMTYECHESASEFEPLVAALLTPLSAAQEAGGSSHTLHSISIFFRTCFAISPSPLKDLMQLLSNFRRLERLELPYALDVDATSALSTALPALRSADVRLRDVAPLASHPALEELDVYLCEPGYAGFRTFAAGPAASRLRKLSLRFGGQGFDVRELPSLGSLTSLERLELSLNLPPSSSAEGALALAALTRLRDLLLVAGDVYPLSADRLGCVARALAALRTRSLVRLRLSIEAADSPAADAALAGLLRAAGPALVELDVRMPAAHRRSFGALAACPRLRALRLMEPRGAAPRLPLREAVGALAALPRLERVQGLPLPFDTARDVDLLRRLAAACSLGAGAGCRFLLRPGLPLLLRSEGGGEGAARPARGRVLSIFPEAEVL